MAGLRLLQHAAQSPPPITFPALAVAAPSNGLELKKEREKAEKTSSAAPFEAL